MLEVSKSARVVRKICLNLSLNFVIDTMSLVESTKLNKILAKSSKGDDAKLQGLRDSSMPASCEEKLLKLVHAQRGQAIFCVGCPKNS